MLTSVVRKKLFGIRPEETSFEARGFHDGTPAVRSRLERVGRCFVQGYHEALNEPDPDRLRVVLDRVDLEFRGFAYEGAAMALALLDRVTPWNRRRLRHFLAGPGDAHAYMAHVAIGWVIGRLGGDVDRIRAKLDPLLGWLAVEGYGFHEGFFHAPRYLPAGSAPERLQGYARRVFDQGLGRSLWFVEGAEPFRISATIAGFSPERQGDLWSGVGLSSTYAGEIDESGLESLARQAGGFHPQLAQGAAFAAKARQRAGNLTAYTGLACRVFCGLSAEEAAQVTDEALENLPAADAEPAFEVWRRRIQSRFTNRKPLSAYMNRNVSSPTNPEPPGAAPN
jgi:hypothetical protein